MNLSRYFKMKWFWASVLILLVTFVVVVTITKESAVEVRVETAKLQIKNFAGEVAVKLADHAVWTRAQPSVDLFAADIVRTKGGFVTLRSLDSALRLGSRTKLEVQKIGLSETSVKLLDGRVWLRNTPNTEQEITVLMGEYKFMADNAAVAFKNYAGVVKVDVVDGVVTVIDAKSGKKIADVKSNESWQNGVMAKLSADVKISSFFSKNLNDDLALLETQLVSFDNKIDGMRDGGFYTWLVGGDRARSAAMRVRRKLLVVAIKRLRMEPAVFSKVAVSTGSVPKVSRSTGSLLLPPRIKPNSYIVRPRDTISVIGRKLNIPWRTIVKINGLEPPYALQAGQALLLPMAKVKEPFASDQKQGVVFQ